MRLEDLTHLGRPVDVRYPTNHAIALIAAVCFVGIGAWRLAAGDPFGDAAVGGGVGALSVFLAWALAREIDPVGERAAFVGAALALAAVVAIPDRADLAAVFWTLLTLRVVNRTTGRTATWLDTVTLLGLTAWGAFGAFPFVAVFAAVAFAIDGFVSPAPMPRHRLAALAAAGVATGAYATTELPVPEAATAPWMSITLGVGAALFAVRVVRADPSRVRDDAGHGPLAARRVRAAQLLALALLGWTAVVGDILPFLPLGCAVVGAGLGPRR